MFKSYFQICLLMLYLLRNQYIHSYPKLPVSVSTCRAYSSRHHGRNSNEDAEFKRVESEYTGRKEGQIIQWYPGHIAKAERELADYLKKVDVVVELRDARIPLSTTHPSVPKWVGSKPLIIAIARIDQISKRALADWREYYTLYPPSEGKNKIFFVDGKTGLGVLPLKKAMLAYGEAINMKRLKKGIEPRPVRAAIIGYPNVGKSALINRLLGRKMAKSRNLPGVTRQLTWVRIGNTMGAGGSRGSNNNNNGGSSYSSNSEDEDEVDSGRSEHDLSSSDLDDDRSSANNRAAATSSASDLHKQQLQRARTQHLELLDSPGIIPMQQRYAQEQAINLAICNDIGQASYDTVVVCGKMLDQILAIARNTVGRTGEEGRGGYIGKAYVDLASIQRRYPRIPWLPPAKKTSKADKANDKMKAKDVDEEEEEEDDGLVSGEEIVYLLAQQEYRGNLLSAADKLLGDFRKGYFSYASLEIPPHLLQSHNSTTREKRMMDKSEESIAQVAGNSRQLPQPSLSAVAIVSEPKEETVAVEAKEGVEVKTMKKKSGILQRLMAIKKITAPSSSSSSSARQQDQKEEEARDEVDDQAEKKRKVKVTSKKSSKPSSSPSSDSNNSNMMNPLQVGRGDFEGW